MKKRTIKEKIFSFNLLLLALLLFLITIAFNITISFYLENETINQLSNIARQTAKTIYQELPNLLQKNPDQNTLFYSYIILNRALRLPLSILNAEYLLIDQNINLILPYKEYFSESTDFKKNIAQKIFQIREASQTNQFTFEALKTKYAAVILPFTKDPNLGLKWIVVYASLENISQLQRVTTLILLLILSISAIIGTIFSSYISNKISKPLSTLVQHIKKISERNFDPKIIIDADDEILELATNINTMAEKLALYDKAQKTFFQNASHELRTPLMSIQSYAEGLKYAVIPQETAVQTILAETNRLTQLVEDLLYLSRLETIEENYHFRRLNFNKLLSQSIERMTGPALSNHKEINFQISPTPVTILADEEKLSRAIVNLISNCLRHADQQILISTTLLPQQNWLELTIADDGPGFETTELNNIFNRFFKGKKGHFGLGLAITKSIIEKHRGRITAQNSAKGAVFILGLPIVN